MTAPTVEHAEHDVLGSDLLANVLLWLVPVGGFVAALLGLG
jgi:hypothetical protein